MLWSALILNGLYSLVGAKVASLKAGKDINMNHPIPPEYQSVIDKIKPIAQQHGYKVYAVGGFVRDLVSGSAPKDLDMLVDGPGYNPAVEFADILEAAGVGKHVATFDKNPSRLDTMAMRFGVAKMLIEGQHIELVMPRGEHYSSESRKPEVFKATVKEDALRRDFTVNTLMLDIGTGEILDPTGRGLEDLKNNVLRSANPDVDRVFSDDPLRMLRAVRFMVTKNMDLDPEIEEGIKRNAPRLQIISGERITEELKRMLTVAESPSRAMRKLKDLGLLHYFMPELEDTGNTMEGGPPYHRDESTFDHIMRTLDSMPPDLTGRLAALLHDIAKPHTRSEEFKEGVEKAVVHFLQHEDVGADMAKHILQRLRFPQEEIDNIAKIVEHHMVPHTYNKDWRDKSLRRFLVDMGQLIHYIFQLAEADRRGSGIENSEADVRLQEFKQRLEGMKDQPIPVKPVINGLELMTAFNSGAGPWIKEIHTALVDFQMEKPDLTKEEAWNFVKEYVRIKRPDLAEKLGRGLTKS